MVGAFANGDTQPAIVDNVLTDLRIDQRRMVNQFLSHERYRSSSREDLVENPLQGDSVSKTNRSANHTELSLSHQADLPWRVVRSIEGNDAEITPAEAIALPQFTQVQLQT